MEQTASGRVAAVLLIDGLTSLTEPHSHLVLDEVAHSFRMHSTWVPYLPYSHNGSTVETTNVFPALFGLRPSSNPGRAGLERMLDGDLHPQCDHFAAFRTAGAESVIVETASKLGVHTRISQYSSDRQTWLLCSPSREARESVINALTTFLPDLKVSHEVSPVPGWRDLPGTPRRDTSRFELVGWCHGALFGALKQCGLSLPSESSILDAPDLTRRPRLAELGRYLTDARARDRCPVVYCKDPAWAARKRGGKQTAIEFCAEVLAQLLRWTQGGTILVVSDHNSEPGRDETLVGATLVGLLSSEPDELSQLQRVTTQLRTVSWATSSSVSQGQVGPSEGNRSAAWQQDELFDYLRAAWL